MVYVVPPTIPLIKQFAVLNIKEDIIVDFRQVVIQEFPSAIVSSNYVKVVLTMILIIGQPVEVIVGMIMVPSILLH